jgi:malonyl CoA-acyl carrier protein transacylase
VSQVELHCFTASLLPSLSVRRKQTLRTITRKKQISSKCNTHEHQRQLLSRVQVTSPVLWENTLQTLLEKGLENSYEIGPNKVIAGIMKRIDKKHPVENISA